MGEQPADPGLNRARGKAAELSAALDGREASRSGVENHPPRMTRVGVWSGHHGGLRAFRRIRPLLLRPRLKGVAMVPKSQPPPEEPQESALLLAAYVVLGAAATAGGAARAGAAAVASGLSLDRWLPPAGVPPVPHAWTGSLLSAAQRGRRARAAMAAEVERIIRAQAPGFVRAALDGLDLTALVRDRVDLDALAATLNIDAVAARIDLDSVADRLDIDRILHSHPGPALPSAKPVRKAARPATKPTRKAAAGGRARPGRGGPSRRGSA